MLNTLDMISRECGLEMNPEKTCIMTNSEQKPTAINNININYVEEYIYLGQNISFKQHHSFEVEKRIKKAWGAYWSLKHIFKSSMDISLKKKALDSIVTPTLLYGCQTWPITKEVINKLQKCQRAMERSMLGLTLRNRIKHIDIRKKTKIIDAAKMACHLKWGWAGHIVRTTDGRWSERVLHWYPRGERRPQGRPRRRWRDDIVQAAGIMWTRTAADRAQWQRMEEAYVQIWTTQ